MLWQHVLSLSIFSSYFLAIIGLFFLIACDLYASSNRPAATSKSWLFASLTGASLLHTWFYMLKYMQWSFLNYESTLEPSPSHDLVYRLGAWLYNTSLFEEAWAYVVFHPLNWWWSEQLCLFTVGAWTVFVATEGVRHKIKHLWAYMLLGQIVAISVASNLFYLALVLSPRVRGKQQAPATKADPTLWLSVLLSLVSVAATPFTTKQTFLLNLLLMHALLFIPLLFPVSTLKSRFSLSTASLYRIIHIAAVLIHLRTVLNAIMFLQYADHSGPGNPATAAWIILNAHPAQSSIGWDIVWTSVSFILWQLTSSGPLQNSMNILSTCYLVFATPFTSVGVTAPYSLLPKKEASAGAKKDIKKE